MNLYEKLIDIWKDRYSPPEFVEHIGIDIEELVQELYPWLLDNADQFADEIEETFVLEEN